MTPEMFELLWKAAAIVFAAGSVWGELRGIRKDIARLEIKQDKYNQLQEPLARLEDSWADAHKRNNELQFWRGRD